MTTVSKRFLPLLMACFLLLPAAIRPIPHVNAQVPSYSPNPPVLSKSFNPSTIPVGGTSRLTISLQNIDTASALTQVILTDTLPDHVVLANPVSPSLNGCGIAGTLTADNGDRELTLNNATIAAGSTCTISVYVTSSEHGVHTNTIPAGAVISREGVTNTNAAVDTLTVISEPQLQVIKTVANTGPFVLNDTITYNIELVNNGNVTLTGVTVTDTGMGTILDPDTCTIAIPADLEPGQSLRCTASHVITPEDVAAGTYINTAVGESVQTGPVEDSVTVPVANTTGLTMKKTVTSNGYYSPGSAITYDIVLQNIGSETLSNVQVTDPGAVLGECNPPLGSALESGESMTCKASHTITQADIDAGSYTNTAYAYANGGSTPLSSDSVKINFTQIPHPTLVITTRLNLDEAGPDNRVDEGDTITYTFTVKNSGNVTLTNISLTSLTPGLTISGGPIASLEPGESDSTTFTASYTLSQEVIDQGSFTISAQASGSPPTGSVVNAQASHTQPLEAKPAVALTKMGVVDPAVKAPFTIANPGDPIRYTFTVENTGNVTLQDVTLNDPDAVITTSAVPAVISVDRHTATITSLAPGETVTISGYRIILVDDFRRTFYKNTATVTGTLPIGRTLPDGQTTVTAMDDHNEVLVADPKIELNTNSTINMAKAGLPDRIDAGDTIEYTFTVTNTGNVPLTDITLTGLVPGVTVSGGPIAELDAGEIDNTTFTASYTLTQMDVDAGSFTNRSEVTGIFSTMDIIDEDEITTPLAPVQRIGAAKRVVGSPVEVSTGVWDVTFEVRIKNYSNVTLSQLQVSEDLSAALPIRKPEDAYAGITPLPAVASFQVQSVTSADFTPNPNFNGSDDKNLLAGRDVLAPDEEGVVQFVVRVTPITGGPFENSVTVSAVAPDNNTVEGRSQNGANPDPDNDGDPTNNNAPTPVGFGNLFQPPVGEKHVATIIGLLQWTMEWMNSANIQPLPVMVYDPIPLGAVYQPSGVPSGYPLPAGQLPSGSTSVGVTCTAASTATKTTACYYEGPTAEFPRGRVIWQGILAPDYQAADMQSAANKITIRFATRVDGGARQIHNTAAAGADLNGDGNISGSAELKIAVAAAEWVRPTELPLTGFAPGVTSYLPPQPVEKAYQQAGDIRLEIPALSVNVPVVGVPLTDGQWDVSWLGKTAGHLAGTGLPTWQGNAVITAHVYDASGLPGPFANLNQLRWGDKILLHAFGSVYEYEVRTARRVQPNDFSIMETQKGAWVTLITCESYDETSASYRYRFAVQAVLLQVRPAGQ